MLTIHDEILIMASPEVIFNWFSRLDENYLKWHPDHVACHYLKGTLLRIDSIVYVEEYLHGELHKMKFKTTNYSPNSKLEYYILGRRIWGSFAVNPSRLGSNFIAELSFGFGHPILDQIFDPILERFLSIQLEAFKVHMKEEGENLKLLLEE